MNLFRSLILLLVIASCTFAPDDINYVEVPKPELPQIEVIQLSLDRDTIFLIYNRDITFHFSAGSHSIMQVGILIDGEEKYIRSNYRDSFTVLASDMDEGVHKLSFSVITNLNNGSIADLIGYEGLQFISYEWTIICIKNDRRAGFIQQNVENGKLKLNWEEHQKINFKSYRVEKRYHKFSGPVKEFRTSEPFLIDEAFVGERAFYDVYTEYYSSEGYEFHWAEIEIQNTLPEIRFRRNADSEYEVYWENNVFSQAVGSYRLIDNASPSDTILLYEGAPSAGNQYVVPGGAFGNQVHYRLITVPAKPDKPFNNDDVYYHSTAYSGLIGDRGIPYSRIAPYNENQLLVLKDNYIYRYSVSDGKWLDSLTYLWTHCGFGYGGFSISPDRKYFTTSETCNNRLVLMQPNNLSDYKSYPINHIITQGMAFNSLPVSDNGIVLARDYSGVYVYDVLHDQKIGSIMVNEFIAATDISSLGNYFVVQTNSLRFYKIIDQKIIPVWESDKPYDYIYTSFAFDPDHTDHVILFDGNRLYHKKAYDFSTVKSFPLVEENILNYDFITRRLLAYSEGYLSVYSIDSGELVFKTKADPRVELLQHSCRLCINTIYLKDGICLHLPV
jgi:hypothetical protein